MAREVSPAGRVQLGRHLSVLQCLAHHRGPIAIGEAGMQGEGEGGGKGGGTACSRVCSGPSANRGPEGREVLVSEGRPDETISISSLVVPS